MADSAAKKKAAPAQRAILLKVLRYLKRYRLFVLISLALSVASVVLTLYIPRLTGLAVDCIVGPGRVDMAGVVRILIRIAAVVAVTAVMQWLMNVVNNRLCYFVVRDIRNDAFRRIEVLPLKSIDRRPAGEIVSRVIADADQFSDGLLMGFTQLFSGVTTIAATLGFMLAASVRITLVVVLITPVSFLVAGFISKRSYAMFRAQSQIRGEQTGYIGEMVSSIRVVQAYGRSGAVTERFDEMNERLRSTSLRATFFSSITNPATRFVNSLVYTGVGIAGAYAVLGGHLTVGMLSSFLSYANQYTKPFNEISGVIAELQNAIACAGRVLELIEEEPETPDAPGAPAPSSFTGQVDIEDVSFSYVKEAPLIEHLDLHVRPGMRVAIVGPTGSGKTTLINLLMRFYDVDGGEIRVDGADIRDITRASLRSGFGMVLQDTWLRSGTIRENLMMGRPDATEEEMVRAARECRADGFIRRLPQGYDTYIGEDGGVLSQGQKQLLCITRVMLCDPPMLILDEATSSIDTRTELRVQEAFDKLMSGRTSFIVAHRLSTIRSADTILVMKNGHIVEQGSHDGLMRAGGEYYTLYQSQFAGRAI